jgi:hypothetical protein
MQVLQQIFQNLCQIFMRQNLIPVSARRLWITDEIGASSVIVEALACSQSTPAQYQSFKLHGTKIEEFLRETQGFQTRSRAKLCLFSKEDQVVGDRKSDRH